MHVSDVSLRTRMVPSVRVQVRRKGATFCGTVIRLSDDRFANGEWFLVDLDLLGQAWAEKRNVRLCSHGCSCEVANA